MSKLAALPEVFEPEEVAKHLGWSPRRLREFARGLGACRILGNRMLLTQADIDAIMEASRPCPSKSTAGEKSGTTGAQLPVGGYAALLALRTKNERSKSQPNAKNVNGKVITMGRKRS